MSVESTLEWLRLPEANFNTNVGAIRQVMADSGFDPEWTADIVDLIEISMSLHERGAINHGKISITAVVQLLFSVFGLKPGNFFSSYGVMRTRAGSRTRFHDELKEALENKMDRDDNKDIQRKNRR